MNYLHHSLNSWVSLGLVLACGLTNGCGGEPFAYVKVSGKITYDDGTVIPANRLDVTFVSELPPKDAKTHSPHGAASVDLATGEIAAVTSHTYGDGLVPGKYKVLVVAYNELEQTSSAVGAEYADSNTTPLVFDTADKSFHFKLKKPEGGSQK